MKELMKHFWERLTTETPRFWKKAQKVMLGCTAAGVGLKASPELMAYIPHSIPDMIMAAGAMGTVLSQFTVTGDETKKTDDKGAA